MHVPWAVRKGVGRSESFENRVEQRLDLLKAMERLRPVYQDILILKFYRQKSYEEIAGHLRLPVGSVKG